MNSKKIDSRLRELSGTPFEEHARFLLLLIDGKVDTTRLKKDKKIDGYKLVNPVGANKKDTYVEVFSVYGKELTTLPGSTVAKNKVTQDLINAMEWAESENFKLVRWNLIINYELDTEFKLQLTKKCKENGFIFKEINPVYLVSKIKTKELLFEAATYFHAVEAPPIQYSEQSNYKIAETAFYKLSNALTGSTDEKLEVLKDINSIICKLAFVETSHYKHKTMSFNIIRNTKIPKDNIVTYKYIEGHFIKSNNQDIDEGNNKLSYNSNFFTNETEEIFIYVNNLLPLFVLCNTLGHQLEQTGTYSIEKALKHCVEDPYGFSSNHSVV